MELECEVGIIYK